jgi:hypothetical protein
VYKCIRGNCTPGAEHEHLVSFFSLFVLYDLIILI